MKTLDQWYQEYGESHQNSTNKRIHYICVPMIFFSIVGLVMSIPNSFFTETLGMSNRYLANWAIPVILLVLVFYLRLSVSTFVKILIFSAICVIGNVHIGARVPLLYFSLGIFVLAWIGQFYGHKVEGKKPSFFQDLQFLLIGPAWVLDNLLK